MHCSIKRGRQGDLNWPRALAENFVGGGSQKIEQKRSPTGKKEQKRPHMVKKPLPPEGENLSKKGPQIEKK